MKTKISLLFAIIACICISSCDKKQISYDKAKKRQTKKIENFIDHNGFEIISKYPTSGVFGEKQFVKLDGGVYLHVIDSGNGNRAIQGKTKLLVRVNGSLMANLDKDSTIFNTFPNHEVPFEFTYGEAEYHANTYSRGNISNDKDRFLGKGLESALKYVGENAIVEMIVPFQFGSAYQLANYTPYYFKKVRFSFSIYD